MDPVIIIPARKNSKRLINKNIKKLGKIPLIEHTIDFSLLTNYKVYVSSDSEEIEKICKKFDSLIFHKRDEELSLDKTSTLEVLTDMIIRFSLFNRIIILLQATSPFRKIETLEKCLKLFKDCNDTVCTVEKIKNPRTGKLEGNKYIPLNYSVGERSQDIPEMYKENGNIYIFKSETLLKKKYFSENIYCVEIKNKETIDIDDELDFNFAESLIEKLF